jgi:hypothetical protein
MRRPHLSKRQVHFAIFVGICLAAILDRFFGAHDAALAVSIFSNGFWILHG